MNNKLLYVLLVVATLASCTSKKGVVEKSTPAVQNQVVSVELVPSEGKKIFEQSCVRCHKLYEPSDFTAQEWQPIMVRMQKKANLNDADAAAVYAYLTTP